MLQCYYNIITKYIQYYNRNVKAIIRHKPSLKLRLVTGTRFFILPSQLVELVVRGHRQSY